MVHGKLANIAPTFTVIYIHLKNEIMSQVSRILKEKRQTSNFLLKEETEDKVGDLLKVTYGMLVPDSVIKLKFYFALKNFCQVFIYG